MVASKRKSATLFKAMFCVLLLAVTFGLYGIVSGMQNSLPGGGKSVSAEDTLPTTTWEQHIGTPVLAAHTLSAPLTHLGAPGSAANPYIIANETDLTYLSYASRLGTAGLGRFAGVHFVQTADIDIGDYLWLPIGSSTYRFGGNYDGGGNSIIGMTVAQAYGTYLGLFSFLTGATVSNIVFEDSYVYSGGLNTYREVYVGTLAGFAQNSEIRGIETNGRVWARGNYVGGLIGIASNNATGLATGTISLIADCTNNADVNGDYRTGGFVGSSWGFSFENCVNNGKITGSVHTTSTTIGVGLSVYVGGLVGFVEGNDPIDIVNCRNTEEVVARGIRRDVTGSAGNESFTETVLPYASANYAGGLVGYSVSTRVTINFTDCSNEAPVTASGSIVGGLGGRVDYLTATGCANYAEISSGSIYPAFNEEVSTIPVHVGGTEVGGLFGRVYRANMDNCINDENATIRSTGYYVGGIIGSIYNNSSLTNVHNFANVSAESAYSTSRGVGGLVGHWASGINRSYVINCTNGAAQDSFTPVPLTGASLETAKVIYGSSVGGAVGYLNNSNITITNFVNYGRMMAQGYGYGPKTPAAPPVLLQKNYTWGNAGGFIGYVGGTGSTITVQGDSSSESTYSANWGILKGASVGGCLGYVAGASDLTLRYFVNKADLIMAPVPGTPSDPSNIKTSNLGGIIGYDGSRSTLTFVINRGNIVTISPPSGSNSFTAGIAGKFADPNTSLTDVTNYGNVTVLNDNANAYYVAGIAGESRGAYTRVTNYGDVSTGGSYVGGLVGYFYGTQMISCANEGSLVDGRDYVSAGSAATSSYVGGLVGITATGTTILMENCVNNAAVNGAAYIGGIMGRSSQTLVMRNVVNNGAVTAKSYYVGGLIGNQSAGNLKIYNSANKANVTNTYETQTTQYATGGLIGATTAVGAKLYIENSSNEGAIYGMMVGGILGNTFINALSNCEMVNVSNTGSVTSFSYSNAAATTFYGGYAGGILGTYAGSYGALLLRNVTNSGAVEGRYVGGIAGSVHTLETHNVKNVGTLTCNFVDLFAASTSNTGGIGGIVYNVANIARLFDTGNTGSINANTHLTYAGGLIAVTKNADLFNCYNTADILLTTDSINYFHTTSIGGLIGYANNSTILNINKCHNTGDIAARCVSNTYGLGGLIGTAYNQVGATALLNGMLEIKNSYVDCSVAYIPTTTWLATLNYSVGVGGLVGVVRGSYNIHNNMVYADLTSHYYLGGIIGYSYTTLNILPTTQTFIVRDCYISGTLNGGTAYSTTAVTGPSVGGVIGYLYFESGVSGFIPPRIDVTIADCLVTAEHTHGYPATRTGGLVGNINFNANTNFAGIQNVTLQRAFYIRDAGVFNDAITKGVGYHTVFNPLMSITYSYMNVDALEPVIVNTAVDETTENPKTIITTAQAKTRGTFDGWDFSGILAGIDRTFWSIAEGGSTFNDEFPYLRNTFSGQLQFNANGGMFADTGGDYTLPTYIFDDYVGNEVTITEDIVPLPHLQYYEFLHWTDGTKIFPYGSLTELTDLMTTLTAVWTPDKYYLSFTNGGTLKTAGAVAANTYISADMNQLTITPVLGSGEDCEGWEVYNPFTGLFVNFADIMGEDFTSGNWNEPFTLTPARITYLIENYSFEENGVKTIRVIQIVTGSNFMMSINFADEVALNNATISVKINDGEPFGYKAGDYLQTEAGATVILTITPKAHYQFASTAITNTFAGTVFTYTPSGNVFTFISNGRLDLLIHLEKSVYDVTFIQKLNSLDGATLSLGTLNLLRNDGTPYAGGNIAVDSGSTALNKITAVTTQVGYRFVGMYALNKNGTYQPYTPGTVTDSFLTNYNYNDAGTIYVYAVFMEQYKITIELKPGNSGDGEAVPYVRTLGGQNERIELDATNSAYIDCNVTIVLEITPDPRSIFAGLKVNDYEETKQTTFVLDEALTIVVQFDLAYFGIVTRVWDNFDNEIVDYEDNVNVITTADNLDSIIVGTVIQTLGLKAEPAGYEFAGWFVDKNGTIYPLSVLDDTYSIDENFTVTNLRLNDPELIDYANDESKLVILARYNKLYSVTVNVNNEEMGAFKVYKLNNGSEELLTAPYDVYYDDVIKVVAVMTENQKKYYFLDDISSTISSADYGEGYVQFTITEIALVNITYKATPMAFTLDTDNSAAQGDVTTAASTIEVGQTVILNFDVNAGYDAIGWVIYDKAGVAHNANELTDNISYTNGILSLKVDEYWIENFGTTFKSKVTTMINQVYFIVLLAGAILIPLLLLGTIIYILLGRKKKMAAAAAMAQSQKAQFGLQTDYVQKLKSGGGGAGVDTLKDKQ